MEDTALGEPKNRDLLDEFIYLLINIPALIIGLIMVLTTIPAFFIESAGRVIGSAVLTAIDRNI